MEKSLKKSNNKEVSQSNRLFTKREWILRYSSPLKSLLFMAIPMVIITLVNSAYGIIDKQLTLHYAIGDVEKLLRSKGGPFAEIGQDGAEKNSDINDFAMQIINISTQYSNTIIFLLNALSIFTCVGTAIKWGQAMGRRDKKEMDAVLVNGIIQTAILSVIGVLILHYSEDFILTSQANIPNNSSKKLAIQYILAHDYTDIFILGFPLLIFATFLSTMLRTEGKVWWIICINLSSIVVNILLGIIIMTNAPEGEKMKAAVYSSMVAWVFIILCDLLVIIFSKNTYLKPQLKNMRLRFQDSRDAWLFGLSPFISNTVFAVANYVLTLLVTTMHSPDVANQIKGTIIIGAFADPSAVEPISKIYITPALRVLSAGAPWSQVLWAPVIGMMQGSNANYAYSKGAGKRFRIFEMWRFQIMIVMTWTIIVEIILLSFGGQMLGIFAGPTDKGIWLFYYMSCFILFAFTVSVMSLFQGIGSAKRATALSLVRSLVCTMSFSIIGWTIAKYGIKNEDGEGDKWLFIFYGWSEIPAFIAAFIIVSNLGKKIIKNNQMNDHKDDFTPPSYLKAILNEIEISRTSKINHTNEMTEHEINKINNSTKKRDEVKNKKIELIKSKNAKKIEIINKVMDSKKEKAKIKHAHQDYAITTNKLEDNLNIIQSKYDVKLVHIKNSDISDSAKNKAIELLTKNYNKRKMSAMKKQDATDKKIEKFKNGSAKLTLFNLITIYSEPQPINE